MSLKNIKTYISMNDYFGSSSFLDNRKTIRVSVKSFGCSVETKEVMFVSNFLDNIFKQRIVILKCSYIVQ